MASTECAPLMRVADVPNPAVQTPSPDVVALSSLSQLFRAAATELISITLEIIPFCPPHPTAMDYSVN